MKTVDKTDYHVHQFIGGYYGICETPIGSNCVFGGDSANSDDYDVDYVTSVYEQWDGSVDDDGLLMLN